MKHPTRWLSSAVLLIAELALAVGIVVGVALGLVRWAECRADRPVRPDAQGAVTLPASKAVLVGRLRRFPTDKEEQTEGYGNEYGRALADERANRKIGYWNNLNDTAQWQFRLHRPGQYEVQIELAVPDESAGSEYEMTIGETILSDTIPPTGGWQSWKTVTLDRIEMPAGVHTLVIKPKTLNDNAFMNLARVILRPVGPNGLD